jgi:tRNA threonylcarbamoyladenosine biosynthesis protein TsaB
MKDINPRRLKKVPASATLLALECSAGLASAAVMRQGEVLAMEEHAADHGHAAWLLTLARDALASAGIDQWELDAVLAGRGPGSFTGIRVALAAAKGLALALDIPGYGIGSLEALAAYAGDGKTSIAALGDTRRRSFFVAAFRPDGSSMGPIADLTSEAVVSHLAGAADNWIIIGHEAADMASRLDKAGVSAFPSPKAEAHASHLLRYFAEVTDFSSTALELEPLYLAAPILGPGGGTTGNSAGEAKAE